MAARIATDEQLLELYRQTQSPTEISRITGIATRNVTSRLRKLKVPPMPTGRNAGHDPYQTIKIAAGRIGAEIENGCVVVFSDAHYYPGIISTAHRALVKLIRELKPRIVVCNGDAFDGGTISRHPRIGWEDKPTAAAELRAVQERLTEVEDAAGKAQLLFCWGNHDMRYSTFLSANAPQYEGVPGMMLEHHFPLWRFCLSLWVNDSVVVKHRYRNGVFATRNNTLNSGKTMVTGHLHSLQVTPLSDYAKHPRFGVDCGTLADPYGPQFNNWTEDNPVNWRSGFVVLSFRNGRLMWPELVPVVDEGVVEFRGQEIHV